MIAMDGFFCGKMSRWSLCSLSAAVLLQSVLAWHYLAACPLNGERIPGSGLYAQHLFQARARQDSSGALAIEGFDFTYNAGTYLSPWTDGRTVQLFLCVPWLTPFQACMLCLWASLLALPICVYASSSLAADTTVAGMGALLCPVLVASSWGRAAVALGYTDLWLGASCFSLALAVVQGLHRSPALLAFFLAWASVALAWLAPVLWLVFAVAAGARLWARDPWAIKLAVLTSLAVSVAVTWSQGAAAIATWMHSPLARALTLLTERPDLLSQSWSISLNGLSWQAKVFSVIALAALAGTIYSRDYFIGCSFLAGTWLGCSAAWQLFSGVESSAYAQAHLFLTALLWLAPVSYLLAHAWQAMLSKWPLLVSSVTVLCGVGGLGLWWQNVTPSPLPSAPDGPTLAFLERLRDSTDPTARILIEETHLPDWATLFPWFTRRMFVNAPAGKGTADAGLHLSADTLYGRALASWSDTELDYLAKVYNIGWIVARSESVCSRMDRWPTVRKSLDLPMGYRLFVLERPHSFVLRGQAQIAEIAPAFVTLENLQPTDDEIVLSFLYHPKLLSSLDRVRIEKEVDAETGACLIRLKLLLPASRATISWCP
ncbi:MAG: hypothetical protein C4297_01000 [Gemmataceae bacterium]